MSTLILKGIGRPLVSGACRRASVSTSSATSTTSSTASFSSVSTSSGARNRPQLAAAFSRQQSRRLRRSFHASSAVNVVKPYLLADIGEGITECQVIQWFVQPGARVEQFDKICEVQSDKASVEITSRFDGVIMKLYYEADDMAKVGKPLIDIDIQSDISPEDEALTTPTVQDGSTGSSAEAKVDINNQPERQAFPEKDTPTEYEQSSSGISGVEPPAPRGTHAMLATPAVRHMMKDLGLSLENISGTGRDGRVTKEDVQKYVEARKSGGAQQSPITASASTTPSPTQIQTQAQDHLQPLTPIQNQMFKTMTRSLSIPHFLYTDNVDFTRLNDLRRKLNAPVSSSSSMSTQTPRLSPLPFIIKAVSLSLLKYPLLNSHLDTTTNPNKPQILIKSSHNIGVAIDTPTGLLVPVIQNVQTLTIPQIAAEIANLGTLARTGKLTSAHLSGATFTVSNIGSIGGGAVAPVIVSPQVGILGVGKARVVPAFEEVETFSSASGTGSVVSSTLSERLVRREQSVFSWSADHRIIDGAMAARCADQVRLYLENVESMLVEMK